MLGQGSRYKIDLGTEQQRAGLLQQTGSTFHHKIGDGSPWIYPWGGSRRVPLSVEFLSVL